LTYTWHTYGLMDLYMLQTHVLLLPLSSKVYQNPFLSCAPGRGALVGVLDLVILTSVGVAKFELYASQKCCATMRIALTCLGVPYAINNGFKWAGSMITRMRPFFLFIKKRKKKKKRKK